MLYSILYALFFCIKKMTTYEYDESKEVAISFFIVFVLFYIFLKDWYEYVMNARLNKIINVLFVIL